MSWIQTRRRSFLYSGIVDCLANKPTLGESPGLVVMGGDSRPESRGFESRCRTLDGHFFTLICCTIVLMFD